MDRPLISVIVPVYEAQAYLPQCLDSILAQSWENWEAILVDDGSTDRSGAICEEYAARDRRFTVVHRENGGVASARNAGLARAAGTWIAWVDSDDWVEPDLLEYLLQGALDHGADVAACGWWEEVGERRYYWGPEDRETLDSAGALRALLGGRKLTMACWAKLIRRELWDGVRVPEYLMSEDVAAQCRVLKRAERTVCLPRAKYHYRIRGNGLVGGATLRARTDCCRAAMEQYQLLRGDYPQLLAELEGGCVTAAMSLWASYYRSPKEERRAAEPVIEEMAAFCKGRVKRAAAHSELGPTGQFVLRLTPHPRRWAFALACGAGRVYQAKHGRPL